MTKEDDEMLALLPCPFCGGEARLVKGAPGCRFVKCGACHASSDDSNAVTLWNTRAAARPPAVDREAVAKIIKEQVCFEVDDERVGVELGGFREAADAILALLRPAAGEAEVHEHAKYYTASQLRSTATTTATAPTSDQAGRDPATIAACAKVAEKLAQDMRFNKGGETANSIAAAILALLRPAAGEVVTEPDFLLDWANEYDRQFEHFPNGKPSAPTADQPAAGEAVAADADPKGRWTSDKVWESDPAPTADQATIEAVASAIKFEMAVLERDARVSELTSAEIYGIARAASRALSQPIVTENGST